MPRKMQTATSAPVVAARIHCPACKSEISSDGATLHAQSGRLDELIETEGVVEKLEKLIEGYEQKLSTAKQEKDAAVAAAVEAVKAAKTQPEETTNGNLGQKETGKQRDDWW
jgi:hypothetical protein